VALRNRLARRGALRLGVPSLLSQLREMGAEAQARALVNRLPAAGWFDLFVEVRQLGDVFRFGLENNRSPAGLWGWDDLI